MVDICGHKVFHWSQILARLLARPRAVDDGFKNELLGINNDVLDPFASPGVGDVDLAVFGLNHGGIGIAVLALVIFEHQRRLPILTIGRYRDVQWAAAFVVGVVVVDEQLPTISKRNSIRTCTRIGK